MIYQRTFPRRIHFHRSGSAVSSAHDLLLFGLFSGPPFTRRILSGLLLIVLLTVGLPPGARAATDPVQPFWELSPPTPTAPPETVAEPTPVRPDSATEPVSRPAPTPAPDIEPERIVQPPATRRPRPDSPDKAVPPRTVRPDTTPPDRIPLAVIPQRKPRHPPDATPIRGTDTPLDRALLEDTPPPARQRTSRLTGAAAGAPQEGQDGAGVTGERPGGRFSLANARPLPQPTVPTFEPKEIPPERPLRARIRPMGIPEIPELEPLAIPPPLGEEDGETEPMASRDQSVIARDRPPVANRPEWLAGAGDDTGRGETGDNQIDRTAAGGVAADGTATDRATEAMARRRKQVAATAPPPPRAVIERTEPARPSAPRSQPAAAPLVPPPPKDLRLLFRGGSDDLARPDQAAQTLQDLVDWLEAVPVARIEMRSYATPEPDDPFAARRRAMRRVLAIRERLAEMGVRRLRISVRPLGEQAAAGPADRIDILTIY